MSTTNEPLPPAGRTNAKTIAAVIVVLAFLAGLLIGIVGDRVFLFRFRGHMMRGTHSITERIVQRLDRELNLTSQQRTEITTILETRRQRIEAITAAVRPQIRREIDQGNAEIEKILTPEQRAKFEKLKMRMLPRRDHHGFAPGNSPPPLTERGSAEPPLPVGLPHP